MLKKFRKAWKVSGEQSRQSRDRDRLFRKEKRRREAFPGKYNPLFYRIIWKNFLYNRKDYVLFLLCGMMLTAFAFSLLGSYEMLAGLHSDEGVMVGVANVGEGLRRIVVNAMVPLGITLVILLIYILIFYLRKRMQGYSMFQTLGIRKKTLYTVMVVEILANMVLSALLGLILGNVMMVLIKNGMEVLLGQSISFSVLTVAVYGKALALVVLVYAITFVGLVYVSDFNPILSKTRTVKSEWMPEKNLSVWIDVGVILTIGGLLAYRKIWSFEKISLVVMCCIGLYVLIRFGGAAFLRKEKQGKHYLDKLMDRNFLYHKSSTLAWYLIAITAISLCAAFYFAFQAVSITIAEEAESLFPYEFMCFTDDEDEEFLEDLKQRYEVKITTYPMVRVISVDKTPYVESRQKHLPQGQHIGISESTYHALKQVLDPDYQPRDLGLDTEGKKIYLVHQQDRSINANPIDYFDLIKNRPCLHVGLPCLDFNSNSESFYRVYGRRTIVGEEIGSLTGCYRDGELEDLVVFSDTYFEQAREMWKDVYIRDGDSISYKQEKYDGWPEAIPGVTILQGPTKLVLIKAKEEDLDAITEELSYLEEEHYADFELGYDTEVQCWYSSKQTIADMKTERIMRLIINGFMIILLLVTAIFFLLIELMSELDEKRERAVFLKRMGMYRKERIRLVRKEVNLFYWVPLTVTTVIGFLFTLATFQARMYSFDVIKLYAVGGLAVWAGYFILLGLFIWIAGTYMIRKVEGKHEQK